MSRDELTVHGRTNQCVSEGVDAFAVSYLVLPLLPLNYERWKQIVQERYCCFMNCEISTFASAKVFSSDIAHTSTIDFVFNYRSLEPGILAPLFDRYFGKEKCQKKLCLQLLYMWVKFVRSAEVEAKLT